MRTSEAIKILDELYDGITSTSIEVESGITIVQYDPIIWEKLDNEIFQGAPTDPYFLAKILVVKYGVSSKEALEHARRRCQEIEETAPVMKKETVQKRNMTPVKLQELFESNCCASCLYLGIRSTRDIRLTASELREGIVPSPFWCVLKELRNRGYLSADFALVNQIRAEIAEEPEAVREPLATEYIAQASKTGDSLHRSAILAHAFSCDRYLRVKGKQYYGRRAFLGTYLYPGLR